MGSKEQRDAIREALGAARHADQVRSTYVPGSVGDRVFSRRTSQHIIAALDELLAIIEAE